MTISEAIQQLQQLHLKYGDMQVCTDCSICGRSTAPNKIVVGPPVATLKEEQSIK